jgi:hypothetical protein
MPEGGVELILPVLRSVGVLAVRVGDARLER